MSYLTLPSSAVDARSPLDEFLMQLIKDNLDDHESRIVSNSSFDYQFKLNGYIGQIGSSRKKRVDGGLISKSSSLTACRILLEDGGTGGDLEIDVRRYLKPNVEISAIAALYKDSIQSIARAGSSLNTQSIARATAQISTQSVSRYKTALNITSIVAMGRDPTSGSLLWKINLNGAPDADYTGRTVILASTSGGTNDGNFTAVRVKDDGGNNIVIANESGAAQNTAAGTLNLDLMKYVFTNPVSTYFVAGEAATFASHTSGSNDGSFTIFGINLGGNNIVVGNTSGVAQAGVAGNANCNEWFFALSAPASATDYVAGETVLTASHSTGGNNGTLLLKEVNPAAGNGLILYNASGATQGGAAGTINTNRWVLAFSTDPSGGTTAGDSVIVTSASDANNRGIFVAKQVNRSAGTNVVVHNSAGVAQGGAAGTLTTAKRKVSFASDQSASITTDSRVLIVNCPNIPEDDYDVSEVNRGGGANYNAVISLASTDYIADQVGPCGRVALESKSVFDTRPKLTIAPTTYNWQSTHGGVSSNMVLNVTRKVLPADTLVFMDVISAPAGNAKNLTVQLL